MVNFFKYRSEIDGLRAVSIAAVLGFHFFPSLLPSGYLGVDIFFVISGFLITRIILDNADKNGFLLWFYSHRIRRLFPALVVVIGSALLFGYFFLFAHEYRELGLHVAKALSFILNVKLYQENGYFDAANESKPLMHLWSLSVEEQFYLLYPIALLILVNRRRYKFGIFLVGIILLLSISITFFEDDSRKRFFLIQYRLWELMAGSMLAYILSEYKNLVVNFRQPNKALLLKKNFFSTMMFSNICSLLGLLLIVTSVLRGGYAVTQQFLAVLGTVLLIATPNSKINRSFLSSSTLVFIGVISYPLYLWHWPILSFMRIAEGGTPSIILRVMGLFFTFILAFFTWKYIEKPIRTRSLHPYDIFVLTVIATLLLLFGFFINSKDGLPDRSFIQNFSVNLPDSNHEKFFHYIEQRYYKCRPQEILDVTESHMGVSRCAQSKKDGIPEVVVIGDSHGEHLFPGLANSLHNFNVGYYSFRCLPFLGVLGHPSCDYMNEALTYIMKNNAIKVVVLAASWPGKINIDTGLFIQNGRSRIRGLDMFEISLTKTLNMLLFNNKKVLVVGDNPSFPFDPSKCVTRPLVPIASARCTLDQTRYVADHIGSWEAIDKAVDNKRNVYFVNLLPLFCRDDICAMKRDSSLLYRDNDHLSLDGSFIVGEELAAIIKKNDWLH